MENDKVISIKLSNWLYEELKAFAKARDMSMSAVVRQSLVRRFQREQQQSNT